MFVRDMGGYDNDTADACCIAIAAQLKGSTWLSDNKVNFT